MLAQQRATIFTVGSAAAAADVVLLELLAEGDVLVYLPWALLPLMSCAFRASCRRRRTRIFTVGSAAADVVLLELLAEGDVLAEPLRRFRPQLALLGRRSRREH